MTIKVDIEVAANSPLTQDGSLQITYNSRPIRVKAVKLVDEVTGDVVWEFSWHWKTYYVGNEHVKTLNQ